MSLAALAAQQQALLAALWTPAPEQAQGLLAAHLRPLPRWQRGLAAYRGNAGELALRVLQAAYPVLAQLLGEDNFRPLARAHWQRHPPQRGDLAQWGGALASHIESLADLHGQEPYLADVARVEWALHQAASAADAAVDTASFALLASHDPGDLLLQPAPGTAGLVSAWPVVSIVNAHLDAQPSLAEAGQRLRQQAAETALVWRQGLKPRLRPAQAGEADFIAALQERRPLGDALLAAPSLDFGAWLTPAVQSGLLVGARLK